MVRSPTDDPNSDEEQASPVVLAAPRLPTSSDAHASSTNRPTLLSASDFASPLRPAPAHSATAHSSNSFSTSSSLPSATQQTSPLPSAITDSRLPSTPDRSSSSSGIVRGTPSSSLSTPPRKKPRGLHADDGPIPSPNRHRVSPPRYPDLTPVDSDHDFALPPSRAFSTSSADPNPPLPIFRCPVNWTSILDQVKQPRLVFDTYSPKNLSKYATLADLWAHYTTGTFAPTEDSQKMGQVPAIEELERRWPSNGKKGSRWTEGQGPTARQRMVMFRHIVDGIKDRMTSSITAAQAQEMLTAECGMSTAQVAAIGRALKAKAPGKGQGGSGEGVVRG
ncbi:hypothetical protein JCM11641_002788 [Rhodosporidiobolus odoratus]